MSKIYGIPTVTPLVPGATGGGVNGKSAYELAVSEGYEGTLTEWLESLVGPQGERGERGPQGATGATGADAPIDTYLPKDGSNPMTGDLPMGGNRISNLGAPVNEDDAVRKRDVRPAGWTPTASDVGARPDTWVPTAEEVGARSNTWVPTAEELGARPNTWMPTAEEVGAIPVINYNNTGCYYRELGGVVEWINPPLALNEEYRTIERYKGLPVYVKAVELDLAPSGSKYVWIANGITNVVSIEGHAFTTDGSQKIYPIARYAANMTLNIYGNLIFNLGESAIAYPIVKYTK